MKPTKSNFHFSRWKKAQFEITLPNNEVRTFSIIHNLPNGNAVNTIESAFGVWCNETHLSTAADFVKFIRRKGRYWAYSENEFASVLKKENELAQIRLRESLQDYKGFKIRCSKSPNTFTILKVGEFEDIVLKKKNIYGGFPKKDSYITIGMMLAKQYIDLYGVELEAKYQSIISEVVE